MTDSYHSKDTIAAIATPPGEGGVAIIRISGPRAVELGDQVFSGPVTRYSSHTAHYGQILDNQDQIVDSALLLVMLNERSYTGEPTVELQCHGGSLIARRVLGVVLQAGARLAQPGEFTYRAYLNGRIDLAQAEAVQSVIAATSERSLDAASDQLEGKLSKRIQGFQRRLVEVAAILEAWVDFPEEGLEFTSFEELGRELADLQKKMKGLVDTFHNGRRLREGLTLCLAGCPNVGKSSLMNALVGRERAIVTELPGTTRDLIEESIQLNGLQLRLLDTAGIRQTADRIEIEGIRRSEQALERADLVLVVLDASRDLTPQDRALLERARPDNSVAIWNKMDLVREAPATLSFPHTVHVSAKQGMGLNELQSMIDRIIWKNGPPAQGEVVLTHLRHKESLERAVEACDRILMGLDQKLSPEFLCVEVREALESLGTIIGQNVTEAILSAIFSRFCLGK